MKKLLPAVIVLLVASFTVSINAQEFNYIGVKKCSMCHKSEDRGAQFQIWEKSAHAKAYETLKSDESNTIAKEAGYETPAVETDACLKCHATGYDLAADRLERGFEIENGVQCETCHGPGSEYKSMKIMRDQAKAAEMGLNVWSSEEEISQMCQGCHNEESPTFKGFDFAEMYEQIKHTIPSE